jgi:general secretion pathway protein G
MGIMKKQGFSLIEILVAVMIITILASTVAVFVFREPGKAKRAKAMSEIGAFKLALGLYRSNHDYLPTEQQGLNALCTVPAVEPIPANYPTDGGYLDRREIPMDPWGNEYVYRVEGSQFEIISYGADGEPGGAVEDADISSLEM